MFILQALQVAKQAATPREDSGQLERHAHHRLGGRPARRTVQHEVRDAR
jgi:hypothetical protein